VELIDYREEREVAGDAKTLNCFRSSTNKTRNTW